MSSTAEAILTFVDLLARLGSIPPERVRLHPAPGEARERDVLEVHQREKRLCELIDGVLVEKAMGFKESLLACALIQMLREHVEANDLGVVAGEAGMLRIAPGLVRIPDVCFISWGQLPGRLIPEEPIPQLIPDLAVEILSETNTPGEIERKVHEYFTAGVRRVWVIDRRTRTARDYRSPTDFDSLDHQQFLDGADVLPGFRVALADLFRASN